MTPICQFCWIFFSSFDYDYGDIYNDDYWEWYATATTTEQSGNAQQGSDQTGDTTTGRRRRKRSTETTNSTTTTLKKTNSASSLLGLNILLYQDRDDYFGKQKELGVVQNNYYGFKVQCLIKKFGKMGLYE